MAYIYRNEPWKKVNQNMTTITGNMTDKQLRSAFEQDKAKNTRLPSDTLYNNGYDGPLRLGRSGKEFGFSLDDYKRFRDDALAKDQYNKGVYDYLYGSQSGAGNLNIGNFDEYRNQTKFDKLGYEPAESEGVKRIENEIAGSQQRENRDLARMGINPTSGRSRSSREQRALNLALARAGARLEARKNVDTQNFRNDVESRKEALSLRGQDISKRNQDIALANKELENRKYNLAHGIGLPAFISR